MSYMTSIRKQFEHVNISMLLLLRGQAGLTDDLKRKYPRGYYTDILARRVAEIRNNKRLAAAEARAARAEARAAAKSQVDAEADLDTEEVVSAAGPE